MQEAGRRRIPPLSSKPLSTSRYVILKKMDLEIAFLALPFFLSLSLSLSGSMYISTHHI